MGLPPPGGRTDLHRSAEYADSKGEILGVRILPVTDARRHLLLCVRRERATHIVKLNAAIAAMVQIRAENALHKAEEAPVHFVYVIACNQPCQAIGAALRAAGISTQIQRVPARLGLARFTFPALVNSRIQQPFVESAVHTPQPFPASRTMHHVVLFYTPIAPITQLARQ